MFSFLVFLIALIWTFLYFNAHYEVVRDTENKKWSISLRDLTKNQMSSGFNPLSLPKPNKQVIKAFLFIAVGLCVGFELILLKHMISPVEEIVKVGVSQLLPDKFNPVARFTYTINWETRVIDLDASISKAYQDKITNYIWRIDDGTSIFGTSKLTHTFANPGYYQIQMSIVDQDNQSDVATCQLLIPPKELLPVSISEHSSQIASGAKSVDYLYVPKGVFFNFSKIPYENRTYANLMSNYIETGCGYSDTSFNVQHNAPENFWLDDRVQYSISELLHDGFFALFVIPLILFGLRRYYQRLTRTNNNDV